jgi:hypothetical protein
MPKEGPASCDRRFRFILSDHGCLPQAVSRRTESSNHSWNDRIPTPCLIRFQYRTNSSLCRAECKVRRTGSASSRGPWKQYSLAYIDRQLTSSQSVALFSTIDRDLLRPKKHALACRRDNPGRERINWPRILTLLFAEEKHIQANSR